MAMTPEAKVKKQVVKILQEFGVYFFYPVTGGYGRSGVPDIVCCHNGLFIGIEVKADSKKNPPTELQLKNLREISEQGGLAMVVDMHNYEGLRTILRAREGATNQRPLTLGEFT